MSVVVVLVVCVGGLEKMEGTGRPGTGHTLYHIRFVNEVNKKVKMKKNNACHARMEIARPSNQSCPTKQRIMPMLSTVHCYQQNTACECNCLHSHAPENAFAHQILCLDMLSGLAPLATWSLGFPNLCCYLWSCNHLSLILLEPELLPAGHGPIERRGHGGMVGGGRWDGRM